MRGNINPHGGWPLLTLVPFFVLYGVGTCSVTKPRLCIDAAVAVCVAWAVLSPSRVFDRHPRIFMFMLGFLLCNILCKLMLAHLCRYKYKYLRSVLIPLLVAAALALAPLYVKGMTYTRQSLCCAH